MTYYDTNFTAHDDVRRYRVRTGAASGREVTLRASAVYEILSAKPEEVVLCEDVATGEAIGLVVGSGGYDFDAVPFLPTWDEIQAAVAAAEAAQP